MIHLLSNRNRKYSGADASFLVCSCLVALISVNTYGQSGGFSWLTGGGGKFTESVSEILTDTDGNLFVCGHYLSPVMTFQQASLHNITQGSTWGQCREDLFVIKTTSSGDVLFAKTFGGGDNDRLYSACLDDRENLYFTGSFSSVTMNIGPIKLYNHYLTQPTADAYLCKTDKNGNPLWAVSGGAYSLIADYGQGVKTDHDQNVIFCGVFDDYISFGGDTLHSSGQSLETMFLAKLDSSGNNLWAFTPSGDMNTCIANMVDVDAQNNIYLCGTFSGNSVQFGLNTLYNSTGAMFTPFIAKFSPQGVPRWAYAAVCDGRASVNNIHIDMSGNKYLAGWFEGGYLSFSDQTIVSAGMEDPFILKIGANDSLVWLINYGNESIEEFTDIIDSRDGNFCVSGYYNGHDYHLDNILLQNTGDSIYPAIYPAETFFGKMNEAGKFLWAIPSRGKDSEYILSMSAWDHRLFIGGIFYDDYFTFNGSAVSLLNPVSSDNNDIFLGDYDFSIGFPEPDSPQSQYCQLFPNPCRDRLNVTCKDGCPIKAQFYDSHGRLVKSVDLQYDHNIVLNCPETSGVYAVKLIFNTHTETKKVLILP